MNSTPTIKTCLGFPGRCDNPVPGNRSNPPFWCDACEKLRREHLDRQFAAIEEQFKR
jgi:hypothetical protein